MSGYEPADIHNAVEVREVVLDAPEPLTEWKLRAWSGNFSRPTIVRNAFTPPQLAAEDYLPRDTKLFANLNALGGFNHTGNGTYTWGELWDAMEQGNRVYGAYGKATNNQLKANLASVLRFWEALIPQEMFPLRSYGHVIFGCTDEVAPTTTWHNGISANLLFQMAGEKLWWSAEELPEGFTSMSIQAYTHAAMQKEVFFSEKTLPFGDDSNDILYERFSHQVLRPGDMLINPPFSWHAIKIDQRSISLSVHGDRNDALAWIAYRYFDGDFDHPLFCSLCNFFWSHEYVDGSKPSVNPNIGQADPTNPNALHYKFATLMGQYRKQRKFLEEYRRRYETE